MSEITENSSNELVEIFSDGITFVVPISEIEKERSDQAFEAALAVLGKVDESILDKKYEQFDTTPKPEAMEPYENINENFDEIAPNDIVLPISETGDKEKFGSKYEIEAIKDNDIIHESPKDIIEIASNDAIATAPETKKEISDQVIQTGLAVLEKMDGSVFNGKVEKFSTYARNPRIKAINDNISHEIPDNHSEHPIEISTNDTFSGGFQTDIDKVKSTQECQEKIITQIFGARPETSAATSLNLKLYKCNNCNASFSQEGGLKIHMACVLHLHIRPLRKRTRT